MKQENTYKFWMVFVEGKAAPKIKHTSLKSATEEAFKLAKLEKEDVHILEAIKLVYTPEPIPEIIETTHAPEAEKPNGTSYTTIGYVAAPTSSKQLRRK